MLDQTPQVIHTLPHVINTYPNIFEKTLYALVSGIILIVVYIWQSTVRRINANSKRIEKLEEAISLTNTNSAVISAEMKNIKTMLEAIQDQNRAILDMSNKRLERLAALETKVDMAYKGYKHAD